MSGEDDTTQQGPDVSDPSEEQTAPAEGGSHPTGPDNSYSEPDPAFVVAPLGGEVPDAFDTEADDQAPDSEDDPGTS
jgi:hypothetical protein